MAKALKTNSDEAQKKIPCSFDIRDGSDSLPPITHSQIWRHYGASALVYGMAMLFFTFTPWFNDLLQIPFQRTKALYLYQGLYVLYLLLALPILFITRPASLWQSKNIAILNYFTRLIGGMLKSGSERPARFWVPDYFQKHALAFLAIKMFYGPLMINSALIEYNGFPKLWAAFQNGHTWFNTLDQGYLLFVSGVFFMDSLLFLFGYHAEAGFLRNRLRMAETDPYRILICVCCYAPFNMATVAFLGPSNGEVYIAMFGNPHHPLTWILRAGAVLALLLLTSASFSLFTKASNLTHRGIVDWGPYAVIRHPGYLGKNLFWLMTLIPVFVPNTTHPNYTWFTHFQFCIFTVWGVIGWCTIYYLRAMAEDAFLSQDPAYQDYCRRVKYRFIPGVY